MYETIPQKPGNRLLNYLKEAKEELKKVTWPSRANTVRYSILIFAVSIAVAAYFGILDYGLNAGLDALLTAVRN
ncbi:MAG: hypothetical protein ACD_76C00161G0007 [uncultured bacterium]|nr:MAG: hypothetical protein ACD_76C00161G0007 [uncultured bacterium]HBD05409.1 preprotein translocase subunit SecE [Candidatus Uhrbacteria bacterium]